MDNESRKNNIGVIGCCSIEWRGAQSDMHFNVHITQPITRCSPHGILGRHGNQLMAE